MSYADRVLKWLGQYVAFQMQKISDAYLNLYKKVIGHVRPTDIEAVFQVQIRINSLELWSAAGSSVELPQQALISL